MTPDQQIAFIKEKVDFYVEIMEIFAFSGVVPAAISELSAIFGHAELRKASSLIEMNDAALLSIISGNQTILVEDDGMNSNQVAVLLNTFRTLLEQRTGSTSRVIFVSTKNEPIIIHREDIGRVLTIHVPRD